MHSWRPVTTSILQWSVTLSVLFNIFINDPDDGREVTYAKFVHDIGVEIVADSPEGHAAVWRKLDRLKRWADKNLTKFNKEK